MVGDRGGGGLPKASLPTTLVRWSIWGSVQRAGMSIKCLPPIVYVPLLFFGRLVLIIELRGGRGVRS